MDPEKNRMIQVDKGVAKGRKVAGEGEEVGEQGGKGEVGCEGEAEQGEGLKEEEQVHLLHVLY